MSASRVVVTGLGAVTAAGHHPGDFWPNLLAGRVTVGQFELPATGDPPRPVYWAAGPDVPWVDAGSERPGARVTQLGMTASALALADAELDPGALEPGTAGVAFGTTHGDTGVMEERLLGLRPADGEGGDDFQGIVDAIAARWGLWGPSYVVATSCSSGLYAILAAADRIRAGEACVMLAGGAETVPPSAGVFFGRLFPAQPDVCRPFDSTRPGMVLGEGAAMLVLEAEEHAVRRGARILARLAGGTRNCDARDMTALDVAQVTACLGAALQDAGMTPGQIDCIAAHGTGTIMNDVGEVTAIKAVYGSDAYRVAVTGIKAMTGHTTGASGPIGLVAAVLAIVHGMVPPTASLIMSDPRCDLDFVPDRGRRMRVRAAQVNAFAFGGANASVIVCAPDEAAWQ
jgi:3-oxoacyl-[acyl-carrier-protein] synthase II